jgi:capsular polysaccharide export protein
VGQVEDDASIRFGSDKRHTNNDLVRIARVENPDAHIVYKPHPDVLHRKRAALSNPDEVRPICRVLDQDVPLADSFQSVDHVYTITSQAGFEALMRGIAVTALGCPFYAGWGLTDDRQPNPRRNRKLSLTEVFAAAYVLYPRYFDPELKVAITPEQAVDRLITLRDAHRSTPASLPPS